MLKNFFQIKFRKNTIDMPVYSLTKIAEARAGYNQWQSSKISTIFYRLKKNSCLDDDVYQSLQPTAAWTPTLYGLPKLQKN